MKAIFQRQNKSKHIVVVNNHQYLMDDNLFRNTLSLAKSKFRTAKQTGIYAVTKGNVTQMVEECYSNAEELMKAIKKYKCRGFHQVHYYLSIKNTGVD